MQNIVYGEFLPLVLGSSVLNQYGLGLEEISTYNVTANQGSRKI